MMAGMFLLSEETPVVTLLNEQLLLIATVIGAIAALPMLLDYISEQRKRRDRIALALEDEATSAVRPRLAGMDALLADIADLVDRAGHPEAYGQLHIGNEILIIGPPLSGKRQLALRMAREAKLDRVITVFNPRNADALIRAKRLIARYRRQKVLLLILRVDLAFEREHEEDLSELQAAIETASERPNVLVVGTAVKLEPNSQLDNLFGTKLLLPGVEPVDEAAAIPNAATVALLSSVARYYIELAGKEGFSLEDLDPAAFHARLLEVASNPAEIEDIVTLCQTLALHRRRIDSARPLAITRDMLGKAIGRVIVGSIGTG